MALKFSMLKILPAVFAMSILVCCGGGGNANIAPSTTPKWTVQTTGTSNTLDAVVWSGTQFVAVGRYGTVLTSPNGLIWTTRISNTSAELDGIVWSGTQFVAVGDNGTIITSPDGVTWTKRTSGSS